MIITELIIQIVAQPTSKPTGQPTEWPTPALGYFGSFDIITVITNNITNESYKIIQNALCEIASLVSRY